jgi:twitching motility protein PilT
MARFRVNLYRQERGMAAVFRVIPTQLLSMEQLGLPDSVRRISTLRAGMVLVTGPTGSGKSTTLAAILDDINAQRDLHVITVEDPIEFVHPNRKALVSQREVGRHTQSFAAAVRAALREDPNVILIGELRDLETIEMALAAASTGVLVFGTLHTNSAAKAVDRIVNVFPTTRQDNVRGMLASCLKAVVAQQLLPRKGGGRMAAIEVLFGSSALAATIRDGRTHQIASLIQTGKSAGMIGMDEALRGLVQADRVEPLRAYDVALDKDAFRTWLAEQGLPTPEEEKPVEPAASRPARA